MKILIFSLLVASSAFAQTTLKKFAGIAEELKTEFDSAVQPATLDDFADVDSGAQTCAVYKNDEWRVQQLGGYVLKWKDAGYKGMGPRFPDVEGESFVKRGLVFSDLSIEERKTAILREDAISEKTSEMVWILRAGQYDRSYEFRKKDPYIYFKMKISGNDDTRYGYCWRNP